MTFLRSLFYFCAPRLWHTRHLSLHGGIDGETLRSSDEPHQVLASVVLQHRWDFGKVRRRTFYPVSGTEQEWLQLEHRQHDLKEEEQKRCMRGCRCRSDLTGSSPVCGVCARARALFHLAFHCLARWCMLHICTRMSYVIHCVKYGLFTGSRVHSAIKSDSVVTLCCIFQARPAEFVAAGDKESFISTKI